MLLAVGTSLDRYVVEARIGSGGMAVVYRVRHAQLGSLHALKVLALPMPSVRDRLLQEGRLQASLRHPNVVAVTDIIDVDGSPGLIMEYVAGPNLEVLLQGCRPSEAQAEALGAGIISGVAYAHQLGLIHRDLKPANVLLALGAHGPEPKVADFGLAKLLTPEPGAMRQTRQGVSLGTPSYMAPEQIRDARSVDKRADVFSLGAILYDLACGAQAFPGDDLLTVFTAISEGRFKPPWACAPSLPVSMVRAIEGALKVNPDERVPDCETLLDMWRPKGRSSLDAVWDASFLKTFAAAAVAPSVARTNSLSDTYEPTGSHQVTTPAPSPQPRARGRVSQASQSHVLLLTDVVDSTRIAESLGDARMTDLWTAHDRAARDLLVRWPGQEIDRTDGFLLLFDSVLDAVRYALDYHEALRTLSAQLDQPLRARVGIHLADVILRENALSDIALGAKPIEVEGLGKPLAARVMSVAAGGQTLLTAAARHALPDAGLRVQSHGHWRMKGISEPVELFEVGGGQAPFTPPPDGPKVYQVVRQGDLWIPRREVRRVLSAETDAFVGREEELQALSRLIEEGGRVVSLLGPGGTGKTRLARHFSWTWLGEFPGGVYFCELAEARDQDGLVAAVARGLDVPLGNDPLSQLGHAIAARGVCLVILDNVEQIVAYAAASVTRWGQLAPQAVFLATSRERLSVPGEQVLSVDPMGRDEAVGLFEIRARAHQPTFAVTAQNRADVLAIVETLDGLPLAIELAAARIRILSPPQLRERLKDRFKVLSASSRGGTARQGTLRATIDWSWDLLAPHEKGALAQLSAFEGDFTLAAAEAVLDLKPWEDAPFAMDVVQALVDKSLLRLEPDRSEQGEPWFGLFSSIHAYAV